MEGNKRSGQKKKECSSVVLQRTDMPVKGKTKGDEDTEEVQAEGKDTPSTSGCGEGEASTSEYSPKRRRLSRSAQGRMSTRGLTMGQQQNIEKEKKKGQDGEKTSRIFSPRKTRNSGQKSGPDDNQVYEVEKIVKVKVLKNGKRKFLIHWKGFSPEFDSWEPESYLDCEDLVKEYFAEHKEVIYTSEEEKNDEDDDEDDEYEEDQDGDDEEEDDDDIEYERRSKVSRKRKTRTTRSQSSSSKRSKRGSTAPRKPRTRSLKIKDLLAREMAKSGKIKEESLSFSVKKEETEADMVKTKRGNSKGRLVKIKKEEQEEEEEEDEKEKLGEEEEKEEEEEEEEDEAEEEVPTAIKSDDQRVHEVEKIINVRRSRDGTRQFLIKWRRLPKKNSTWEPESNLNCDRKLQQFLNGEEQVSCSLKLRVNRKKTVRYAVEGQLRKRKRSKRLGKKPQKSYKEIDTNY